MEVTKLQEYYNRIDRCSVSLDKEADFEYIQTQISKIAMHTEEMNRTIGELLIEKVKLEHQLTDVNFEYELKYTEHMNKNSDVKNIHTGKERKDYINYFLLKDDYKKINNIKLEIKDLDSLIDFAKKKAKDLDRLFPKLQTLWESIQTEMKYIKKIGSDSHFIDKVRKEISEEQRKVIPIFTDKLVEEIKEEQYSSNNTEPLKEKEIISEDTEVERNLDSLLSDL